MAKQIEFDADARSALKAGVDKLANELASLAPETMKFGLEAYEKQREFKMQSMRDAVKKVWENENL